MKRPNYGRNDLMVTAAFRYCLGRCTYIVSDCVDWLKDIWPTIQDGAKYAIIRELKEAIQKDDEDRAEGREHKTLGHDCDRAAWLDLMAFIEKDGSL